LIEPKNLSYLVIGLDVVPIAISAKKAGYQVFSVDYFGDQDLRKVCTKSLSILRQRIGESSGKISDNYDVNTFLRLVENLLEAYEVDGVFLSSGVEDSPKFLSKLDRLIQIIGNSPEKIRKVRDKKYFFEELSRLKIPHPETRNVSNLKEAEETAKEIGFPVVVKPLESFGGIGIRKANDLRELKEVLDGFYISNRGGFLIQKFVLGKAASASLVSIPNKAVTLTVNEQFLGMHELGQMEPFGYCGNLVPLSAPETIIKNCGRVAEEVISKFGLIGLNGVDFIISNNGVPYVVEVNPRFQGTHECVERVLGLNLVETHLNACIRGILPKVNVEKSSYCVRLIVFAHKRSVVPDLTVYEVVRDISVPGVIVEGGEPVCSVLGEGDNSKLSYRKTKSKALKILQSLNPLS
jgi:predicted ATP-grasp superfamily ATP-dependent carboligase